MTLMCSSTAARKHSRASHCRRIDTTLHHVRGGYVLQSAIVTEDPNRASS
jgi:hypothetical protein